MDLDFPISQSNPPSLWFLTSNNNHELLDRDPPLYHQGNCSCNIEPLKETDLYAEDNDMTDYYLGNGKFRHFSNNHDAVLNAVNHMKNEVESDSLTNDQYFKNQLMNDEKYGERTTGRYSVQPPKHSTENARHWMIQEEPIIYPPMKRHKNN